MTPMKKNPDRSSGKRGPETRPNGNSTIPSPSELMSGFQEDKNYTPSHVQNSSSYYQPHYNPHRQFVRQNRPFPSFNPNIDPRNHQTRGFVPSNINDMHTDIYDHSYYHMMSGNSESSYVGEYNSPSPHTSVSELSQSSDIRMNRMINRSSGTNDVSDDEAFTRGHFEVYEPANDSYFTEYFGDPNSPPVRAPLNVNRINGSNSDAGQVRADRVLASEYGRQLRAIFMERISQSQEATPQTNESLVYESKVALDELDMNRSNVKLQDEKTHLNSASSVKNNNDLEHQNTKEEINELKANNTEESLLNGNLQSSNSPPVNETAKPKSDEEIIRKH